MRKSLLAIAVALLIASGCTFLFGYLVGAHQFFPYSIVKRVEQIAANLVSGGAIFPGDDLRVEVAEYPSIFLNLRGHAAELEIGRSGAGGGLTSFGPYVVLLAHDGTFFAATDAENVVRLTMQAPDNHFQDYVSAAKTPPFDTYTHNFDWFRYNDIQYFKNDSMHGFIASYTAFDKKNNCYNTTLSRLLLPSALSDPTQIQASAEEWEIIFETKPCLPLKKDFRAIEGHMAGGRITYDGIGTVYLGSGDYSWDGIYAPEALAQALNNDYGKIMAIDVESGESRTVAIGTRNVQGITIDTQGQLWTVEHGVRGGDEINRIIEGENYGWPEESLGTLYSSLPIPNTRSYGRHDTFRPPVFAWLPSIAISGLTTITGFHEAWDGDFLAPSLKDGALHRIRILNDRVLFAERIPIGERLRYVLSHDPDTIVVWTDHKRLIFLQVADRSFVARFVSEHIQRQSYSDADKLRVQTAVNQCMECHSFHPTDNSGAPSLAMVFGAKVGSTQYKNYTSAFKSHGGQWTEDNLRAYLRAPSDFIPGTAMPTPAIEDDFIMGEIIGALKAIRSTPQKMN